MPDNTLMRLIDSAVVLVLAVGLAVVVSRQRQRADLENRRREQIENRDQAADLRARGREDELHAAEFKAAAAQQQADALRARAEAESLEAEAQRSSTEARRAYETAEGRLAEADRLDPAGRPDAEGSHIAGDQPHLQDGSHVAEERRN